MITILVATSALFGAPSDGGAAQDRCTIIRYAADGRRTESFGYPADFGVDVQVRGGPGHASASARSNGSSSSSVSMSSSTRGDARSSSSASFRDGDRTVTTHTDDKGCTVVIDDRPADRRNR
jgi:hypothetical protein